MAQLTEIWRHPIKAIGREAIETCDLTEGQTLPGDRLWAVAHEAASAGDQGWARCSNFIRAASSPALMAVEARCDGETLHLTHPDLPPLSVHLPQDGAALVNWVAPLVAEGRASAARLVSASEGRGLTDTQAPSITLGSFTSHKIVEQRLGRRLSHHRWRCNLWVEGLDPWEEFDLLDKTLRLGSAEFHVARRVDRCAAPGANPETGKRDADLLSVLESWDHQDFTVELHVTKSGTITIGDTLEVL